MFVPELQPDHGHGFGPGPVAAYLTGAQLRNMFGTEPIPVTSQSHGVLKKLVTVTQPDSL